MVTTALSFVMDNEHQYTQTSSHTPRLCQPTPMSTSPWHPHTSTGMSSGPTISLLFIILTFFHFHDRPLHDSNWLEQHVLVLGEDWITNTVLYLTAATWYSTQPLPPSTLITELGPVSPALSVSPVGLKWTQHLNDTTRTFIHTVRVWSYAKISCYT